MNARAATPLFIDTGAFIAWYDEDDQYHDQSKAVFQAIRSGDLPYRPLYTSRYVLSELATRLQRGVDHATTADALKTVRLSSSFNIERVGDSAFDRVCEEFERYNDRTFHSSITRAACCARTSKSSACSPSTPTTFGRLGSP